jgi:hypothetical protein
MSQSTRLLLCCTALVVSRIVSACGPPRPTGRLGPVLDSILHGRTLKGCQWSPIRIDGPRWGCQVNVEDTIVFVYLDSIGTVTVAGREWHPASPQALTVDWRRLSNTLETRIGTGQRCMHEDKNLRETFDQRWDQQGYSIILYGSYPTSTLGYSPYLQLVYGLNATNCRAQFRPPGLE